MIQLVNIDSRDRNPTQKENSYRVELATPIEKPKRFRIMYAEIPNSIYNSIEEDTLSVLFENNGSQYLRSFAPFESGYIYQRPHFGVTNPNNYGLNFSFSETINGVLTIFNFKIFYNTTSYKVEFFSSHSFQFKASTLRLAKLLGLSTTDWYLGQPQNYDIPFNQRSLYANENFLVSRNQPINLLHPLWGTTFDRSSTSGFRLFFGFIAPKMADMNAEQYIYMHIKELAPFASKHTIVPKSQPQNAGAALRVQLSQNIGSYIYYSGEHAEFMRIDQEKLSIRALNIEFRDYYGELLDFNGIDNSFQIEFICDMSP